ncbi:MAG: redoxin domain-containing protein [Luminiphilus sp.]|nr:redoxin domain-containing protein [Luminiphilus sp.]
MRDAFEKFEAKGIKLYALSYDDQETLEEFGRHHQIPYTLLSDIDSSVIKQFGLLNTEVSKSDAFLYGIPFPGVYICNENGIVLSKFFHDSYKKRESPEALIDAALGKIVIDENAPKASVIEGGVAITASVRGGNASLRQGIIRQLIIRFELPEGLHIYGDPVPEGLTATTISVAGPEGLQVMPAQYPPSSPLRLESLGVELQVWSGQVDVAIPIYATGELASECRPLDAPSTSLSINIHYQACDDTTCLLPTHRHMTLDLPLDVIEVPNLPMHTGHGQREGDYDSLPALRRLLWRKIKRNPLRLIQFILKNRRLERAARQRQRKA